MLQTGCRNTRTKPNADVWFSIDQQYNIHGLLRLTPDNTVEPPLTATDHSLQTASSSGLDIAYVLENLWKLPPLYSV